MADGKSAEDNTRRLLLATARAVRALCNAERNRAEDSARRTELSQDIHAITEALRPFETGGAPK